MTERDERKPRRRWRRTMTGVLVGCLIGYLPGLGISYRLASDAWANESTDHAIGWTIISIFAGILPVLPLIALGGLLGGVIAYVLSSRRRPPEEGEHG